MPEPWLGVVEVWKDANGSELCADWLTYGFRHWFMLGLPADRSPLAFAGPSLQPHNPQAIQDLDGGPVGLGKALNALQDPERMVPPR